MLGIATTQRGDSGTVQRKQQVASPAGQSNDDQ